MNARATPDRDQEATPFSEILHELCQASGARCAVLVDREGETVDYAGRGEPFDIRVLAAEWRLIFQHVGASRILGNSTELFIRAKMRSYFIEALPEGYALVVELPRRATAISARALGQARLRLCEEAGFPGPPGGGQRWARVAVEEEPGLTHRPARMEVERELHDVTVLGRIPDLEKPRDRSFRVRLSSGEECTLVREPLGHWYLEEDAWAPPSRVR